MSVLRRVGLFLITNLLILITFGIVISLLGIRGEGVYGLMLICFVWGMGGAFFSLLISRWMAKKAYGIQVISPNTSDANARWIYNMVQRLIEREGLPMPEVGVYHSNEPNAFATGSSPKKSIIAFSTGLLNSMNHEQIQSVAAHEISHIKNGDMLTLTLLTGLANAFVMFLARIIAIAIDNFLRGDDDRGGLGFLAYFLVVSVLETVFMLLAYIPIAAFSRWREYRADAGSAKLTSPSAMASALETLGGYTGMLDKKNSFSIAKIQSRRRVSIFSTHPSIESRIKRLREMNIH